MAATRDTSLVEAFRYNRWANTRLFDACRVLDDTVLDAPVGGVSDTPRRLLVHIASGQQAFVARTQGFLRVEAAPDRSDWPGFRAIVQLLRRSDDELVVIAEQLDATEGIELHYMGKAHRYPKQFFLVHALAHGIEHRTEVKVALGHLGVETPDLDGWEYAADQGYGREPEQ